MNTLAIIVACGKEEELSPGVETAFISLGDRPLLAYSIQAFEESSVVDGLYLVVSKDRIDSTIQLVRRYGLSKIRGIVTGSSTRLSSLRTALSKMKEEPSCIVLHEASRPFIKANVIDEIVKAAKRYGCAIGAHRIPDAVKLVPKGLKAGKTLERNSAWAAQTPQAFKTDLLKKILDPKNRSLKLIDDESEYAARYKANVHLVETGGINLKIRSSDDLAIATALYNALKA